MANRKTKKLLSGFSVTLFQSFLKRPCIQESSCNCYRAHGEGNMNPTSQNKANRDPMAAMWEGADLSTLTSQLPECGACVNASS